jgi:hypothetical protein
MIRNQEDSGDRAIVSRGFVVVVSGFCAEGKGSIWDCCTKTPKK